MSAKLEAAEAAFPEGEHTTRATVLAFREAFEKGWDAALTASKERLIPAYRVVHASASILNGHVKAGDLVRSKWGSARSAVWECSRWT